MSKDDLSKSFNELDNSSTKLRRDQNSVVIDTDSSAIKKSNSLNSKQKTDQQTTNPSGPLGLVSRLWESISLGSGRQKENEKETKVIEQEALNYEENEVNLQFCAKQVLKELRDLDKEDIVNELLDDYQIQNEEELRSLEEGLNNYLAEEYGDDSDDDEILSSKKKIKIMKSGLKLLNNKITSRRNESLNSSLLVINLGSDDPKIKEIDRGIFQKEKSAVKPIAKPKQRGTYEVFKNSLIESITEYESSVHLCYTREEEMNISRYELFACEYNTQGSTFDILFKKKDPKHIFINEKILYITKKTNGNFGVIEEYIPLPRLAKIFSSPKGSVLKFTYYDDETPGYSQKEISLKVTDRDKLLSVIQENLQFINSSIRIHQTAEIDV